MTVIQDIYKIVNTAKRNTETVIWSNSLHGSNQRPERPYVAIHVLNIRQLGQDQYENQKTTIGTGADERLKMKQTVHNELTLNIQYISDSFNSVFEAEELRAYLQSDFMNNYISSLDTDIGFMRSESTIDVSTLINDAFENRASFDIVLSLAIERQELVQFIETLEISGEIRVSESDIIVSDVEINF